MWCFIFVLLVQSRVRFLLLRTIEESYTYTNDTKVMKDAILGLHHITAIAGSAQINLDFYTKVLGLKLIKKTVNFDDPGTYHFYFGDQIGTPGSILTFFPWEGITPGRRGTGMATEIGYAVPKEVWISGLVGLINIMLLIINHLKDSGKSI